jgi:glutaminase
MFHQLLLNLSAAGRRLLFVHPEQLPALRRFMRLKLGERFAETFCHFDDIDRALEWCENQVLQSALGASIADQQVKPEGFALFAGLNAKEIDVMKDLLIHRKYEPNETIIKGGEDAAELFILTRGRVSVQTTLPTGAQKRLASFSPGMAFGELAVIDRAPRSAMIVADTSTECAVLRLDHFDRLDKTHPEIKLKLWRNLCLDMCSKLRKANRELSVFD